MFQPGLFDSSASVSFDAKYSRTERVWLDESAWVEQQAGWVTGSDVLFEQLRSSLPWKQRKRFVWGEWRTEPRLTAPWFLDSGKPLEPTVIEEMRQSLSKRCGVTFDSVGFNLYRDGDDAVAWHRDTIDKQIVNPVVVLVSLGEPRKLQVRPYGGGPSKSFSLGRGELLITGGTFQRTWEHTIPRVAGHAGPRISLAFRHGLDPRSYE
jgi:alkylated DNA repair dioxygenase AlkB